jgi:hypothetical protein
MRLVISLPTRGRPGKLVETIGRDLMCLSRPDTMLMVQVDEDDTNTVQALQQTQLRKDQRLVVDVRPREDTIAAKWNRALIVEADVYTCLADDDPLVTPGSDEKILQAASIFPDGIGAVYGHLCNASFSCCISFTKRMTDLLGYIQPEYFPYWFCDHWTDDLMRMVGRIAFADVRTFQTIELRMIEPTQEMREPAWWATWFDANYLERREHAQRIITAINDPDWMKLMHYNCAPMIDYRSRWVNDNVRRMFSFVDVKDERYQRVKQKALDAVPDILSKLPPPEADKFREMLTPPTTILNLRRAYG